MPFLYRTPVLVSKQQPYVDWANSFDDGVELSDDLAREKTVYLVETAESEATLDEILTNYWQDIFDEELFAWMEDEATWPTDRDRAMFDRWFEAALAGSVVDLDPEAPLTDGELDAAALQATMSQCAWCERELDLESGEGRTLGVRLEDRELLAHREGLVLTLMIDRKRAVNGAVPPRNSDLARDTGDVIFLACSRRCEKRLEASVPRALRELTERLAKQMAR